MYVLKMILNNRIWKTKRLQPQLRQPPQQQQLQPRLQELVHQQDSQCQRERYGNQVSDGIFCVLVKQESGNQSSPLEIKGDNLEEELQC